MRCTAYLLNIFVAAVGEGEALEKLVTVCNTSHIYGLVILTCFGNGVVWLGKTVFLLRLWGFLSNNFFEFTNCS